MSRKYFAPLIFLFMVFASASVYKWVDEEGRVHYTDKPPEEGRSQEIDIKRGPPQEAVEKAQQRLERIQDQLVGSGQERAERQKQRTLGKLGPWPSNASSEYLETVGSGILVNFKQKVGRFSITVRMKPAFKQSTAYFEAQFPNPANPTTPVTAGMSWQAPQEKVSLVSPPVKLLKCRKYEVIVKLCHWRGCEEGEHDVERRVYGIHRQLVQSAVDLTEVRSTEEAVRTLHSEGAYCP